MKRLFCLVVLCFAILLSCTKPLDNIVVIGVNDKNSAGEATPNTSTDNTIQSTQGTTTASGFDTLQTSTFYVNDGERVLIINKSSKKVHLSFECTYADKILDENKIIASFDTLYTYLQSGYDICSYCQTHY